MKTAKEMQEDIQNYELKELLRVLEECNGKIDNCPYLRKVCGLDSHHQGYNIANHYVERKDIHKKLIELGYKVEIKKATLPVITEIPHKSKFLFWEFDSHITSFREEQKEFTWIEISCFGDTNESQE
jgi:hypothetical protein